MGIYVYCICRITKFWKDINQDLSKRGYKGIKAYIPYVNVLKSTRAGKNVYTEVPLLFHYGFIKMKTEKAYDRQFLKRLRKDIPGIMGWMYSPETMHERKKRVRIDESYTFDDFSMVATVSREEVKYYKDLSKRNQIFSRDDIVNLKIGDYINLRGYPFEGIGAQVEEVNLSTKMIKVILYPNNGSLVVSLPLDNILYSIYNDYDENKLRAADIELDVNQIPDNAVDKLLTLKQY